VAFRFFDNDPLFSIRADQNGEVSDVLRFLVTNYTEIVTHLVVCGPVPLVDRPGHKIYGDTHISLPDDRNFRKQFRQFKNDFEQVCQRDTDVQSSFEFMKHQIRDIKNETLWSSREKYLDSRGFRQMILCYKMIRSIELTVKNTFPKAKKIIRIVIESEGVLPPKTNRSTSNLLQAMTVNRFCDEGSGFLALKQLVSYVVSPQENPLEPDASLRALYGLRVCRVRRDAEDALDTLHRELISRCLSLDFQLFQHEEKNSIGIECRRDNGCFRTTAQYGFRFESCWQGLFSTIH
jgi:hypothetical protein